MDSDKHSSLLQYEINYGLKKFCSTDHYKTLRIRNLRKMERFLSKLVSFLLSVTWTNTLAYFIHLESRRHRQCTLPGALLKGRPLALPAYIRLGWKSLSGTNARDYYEKSQLTTVKSFLTLALGESKAQAVQATQT